MQKSDFNKVAKLLRLRPVNLLYIFRTPFPGKNLWRAASGYEMLKKRHKTEQKEENRKKSNLSDHLFEILFSPRLL